MPDPTSTPEPARRVTMDDIAAHAGVSNATVSRALGGLPNVTPATRDRVLEAARELGYRPDHKASRVAATRRRREGTIGIVVPVLDQWFYAKIAASIEETLATSGLEVIRYTLATLPTNGTALFDGALARDSIDGLIAVSFPMRPEDEQYALDNELPAVTVNAPSTMLPSVRIDDEAAAEMVVRHLLNLGHRRIGLITSLIDDPLRFRQTVQRVEAFRQTLEARGVEVDDRLVLPGNQTAAGGADAMAIMLAAPNPPTAVFAISDEMAIGAVHTIRSAGLSVPEDISVIGFDDHDLSAFVDLTTVRQDVADLGVLAAEKLLRIMRKEPIEACTTLPTQLMLRGTAGKAPV